MKIPLWKIIGFLIWAVLTVATLTFCSPSNSWTETSARVTEVSREPYVRHSGKWSTTKANRYHYKYKYSASGKEYPAQSDDDVDEKYERPGLIPRAVGQKRTVFFDPKNPEKYQFEKGPEGVEGVVLIAALALESFALLWIITEKRF